MGHYADANLGDDRDYGEKECPDCNGTGLIDHDNYECGFCSGHGTISRDIEDETEDEWDAKCED